MPEISTTTTLVTLPTSPRMIFTTENFFYEPLGSRDTYLSRLFNGGYDESFVPFWSQQDQRYANQGIIDTIGNFALNLGMDLISEGVLRPVATLTSLASSPFVGVLNLASSKPISFADIITGNPINMLADGIQNLSTELAPLFTQEGYAELPLFEQLKSPGQYVINNAEAISNLLSFISVFKLGGKLGGVVGDQLLTPAMMKILGRAPAASTLSATEFITANALSTLTEASVEAQEVYHRIIHNEQALAEAQGANFDEISDITRERADRAFTNTFALNAATLAITNSILAKTLSPLLKRAGLSKVDNAYQLTVATEALAEKKFTSPLARFFLDKGHPVGMFTKGLLIESANNALEENLQFTYGKIHEEATRPLSLMEAVSSAFHDFINQDLLNEEERLKSTFLGGVLGGATVVGASLLGVGPYQEAKRFASQQQELLSQLNKQYTEFNAVYNKINGADLYERTPQETYAFKPRENGNLGKYRVDGSGVETFIEEVTPQQAQQIRSNGRVNPDNTVTVGGDVKLDESGRPVLNPSKLAAFLRDHTILQETFDQLNAALSAQKSEDVITYLTNKALTPVVLQAYLSGSVDILKEKLKTLLRTDVDGIDKTKVQARIAEVTSYIDKLSKVFREVQEYMYTLDSSDEAQKLNSKQKSLAFNLGAIITNLEDLQRNLNKKIEASKLDDNFMAAVNELLTNGKIEAATAAKLQGQYEDSKVKEIAEAIVQAKEVAKTLEQLKKDYDALINPLSRDQAFKDLQQRKIVKGPTKYVLGMSKEDYLEVKKAAIKRRVGNSVTQVLRTLARAKALESIAEGLRKEISDLNTQVTTEQAGKVAEELFSLVNSIVSAGGPISEKTKSDIADIIERLKLVLEEALVEAEKFGLRTYIENPGQDGITIEELLEEPSIAEVVANAVAAKEAKNILDKIDVLVKEASTNFQFEIQSEQEAEQEFINELLVAHQNIIELAEAEDFLDLESIDYVVKYLEGLYSVEPLERIEKLLKKAKEALNVVAKRLAKRELDDLKEAMASTISLNKLQDLLDADTYAQVEEVVSSEPVLGYFLAMDKISAQDAIKALKNLSDKLGIEPKYATQTILEYLANVVGQLNEKTQELKALALEENYAQLLDEFKKIASPDQVKVLKQLISYAPVIDFLQLVKNMEDDVRMSLALSKIEKAFRDANLAPTAAQVFSVLQIVAFAKGYTTHQVFQDIVALRAPAGAGKTSMIIPMVLKALDLGIDHVVAFASTEAATKILKENVKSAHDISTVEDLVEKIDSGQLAKTVQLIVIDEAGGLRLEQLNALSAAIARHNLKGHNVKVLLAYDPAQTGLGQTGIIQLDGHTLPTGQGDIQAALNGVVQSREFYSGYPFGIGNIFRTQPLKVTFRASSLEITNLAKFYRLNVPNQIETISNVSSQKSDEPFFGTYAVDSTSELERVLNEAIALAPQRSRLIIVSDNAKEAYYKERYPKVTVIKIEDARGVAAEEVYVDLGRGRLTEEAFAKQMYTAITRGVDFVAVVSDVPYTNVFDPDSKNRNSATRASKLNYEGRYKLLRGAAENAIRLGLLTQEEADIKIDVGDGGDGGGEDDGQDGQGNDENFFVPKHPASELFNLDENIDIPSDEIYVAKTDEGNGKFFIRLLVKTNEGHYATLAILNEQEVDRFTEFSGVKLMKLPLLKYAKVGSVDPTGKVVIAFSEQEPKLVSTVKFSADRSHPLAFAYSENEFDLTDSVELKSIYTKILSAFYDKIPDQLLEDGFIAEHAFVRIYTTEKELKEDYPKLPAEKRPHKGRPYLIIKGVPSPSGKVLPTMFVPLKAGPATQQHTQAIRELISYMEEAEKLFASLGEPYAEVKFGKPNKDGFFIAHALITRLATLAEQGSGSVRFLSEKAAKGVLSNYPDLEYDKVPKRLLEVAKQITLLLHGNLKSHRGNGPAQSEFNALARTNLLVTTKRGRLLVLRDYQVVNVRGDVTATGVPLLGPLKFYMGSNVPYLKTINTALRDRLLGYLDSLHQRGKSSSARAKVLEEALKEDERGTISYFYYTVEDLKELFIEGLTDGVYKDLNEGFSLRSPLPKRMNVSIRDVEGYTFTHNIREIYPTQIVIAKRSVTEETEGPRRPDLGVQEAEMTVERAVSVIKRIISLSTSEFEALAQIRNFLSDWPDLAEEAVRVFNEQMEHTDLSSSVYDYYQNSRKGFTQKTLRKMPITALIKLYSQMPHVNRATWAIQNSPFATEVGTKAGNYAARDFVRAAILADILNLQVRDSNTLLALLDLTRERPNSAYQFAKFAEVLTALNISLNDEELFSSATTVLSEYSAALQRLGIVVPVEQVNSVEGLLKQVEKIVLATSTYREGVRQQQQEPSIDFSKIKEDLLTALETDTYELFLSKYSDTLKKLSLPTDSVQLLETLEGLEGKPFTSEVSPEFDMTPQQANEYAQRFVPKSLKTIIKNIFVKRVNSDTLRFIDFNRLQNSKGQAAYGLYKEGVIHLMQSKEGFVSKHVLRHEIFHKLFWEYLTTEERLRVLDLAREVYGNLDVAALEEKLAEDFAKYERKGGILNALRNFFNHLLRLLGFSYRNFKTLEDLFFLMDTGALNKRSEPRSVERAMLFIPTEFSSLEAFEEARAIFIETFDKLLKSTNPVYSFDEAVVATITTLANTTFEDPIADKAVKTLLIPHVLHGFLDKYFGAAYIEQASKRLALTPLKERKTAIESRLADLEALLESDEATQEDMDEYLKLEDELSSIADQLKDSDTINPEDSLSARVKQRLANITYTYRGQVRFVDVSTAFNMILPVASGIQATSLRDYIEQLSKRIHAGVNLKAKGVRAAVASRLAQMLDQAAIALIRPINERVSFRRDMFSTDFYAIVSTQVDVSKMSLQQALKHPQVKVHFLEGRSLDALVKDVLKDLPGYSYEQVAQAYQDFELINFVIALHFATASTYRKHPFVGTERFEYGSYKSSYYELKTQASRRIDESRVVHFLTSYLYSHQHDIDTLRKQFAPFERAKTLSVTMRRTITEFLKNLNLSESAVESLQDQKLLDIGTAAYYAFRDLDNALRTPSVDEEGIESRTIETVVNDQGTLIAHLTEALNQAGKLSEGHSYRKAGGQTAYAYTNASLQHDKGMQITYGTTDGHTSVVNGKIITEDPFLIRGVFSKAGPGVLFRHIVHDSMKSSGGTAINVFKRERPRATMRRQFTHGFLDTYYQSRGAYYTQFMPVPASRKNIEGFQVKFLSEEEAKRGIELVLQNQANRPENIDDPTYKKRKDTYIFAGIPKGTSVKQVSPRDAAKMVIEHLERQAEELSHLIDSLALQSDKVSFAARKLGVYQKDEKTLDELKSELIELYKQKERSQEAIKAKREEIKDRTKQLAKRLFRLFLYNYTVNLYGLSEWIYGDPAFFSSKENLTKRIQIATSPGYRPLIDPVYGLPEQLKVTYFKDPVVRIGDEVPNTPDYTKDQQIELTDSNAYILPETYEAFARGSSIEFKNDIVLKPMYAGLEAKTYARKHLKFSVIVLTDEFVEKFPRWAKIRDFLRANGTHLFVPKSAAKVAAPTTLIEVSRDGEILNPQDVDRASSILESRFMRINLNLAKSVDSSTAYPVQAPAVVNSNGLNTPETWLTYLLHGVIIDMGRRSITRALRLTAKGTATHKTLRILRDRLIESAKDLPGYEDVYYLLKTEDVRSTSINLPVISDKLVSLLASALSRSTVSIRFKGSKLVLQSDFGTDQYIDDKGRLVRHRLRYKNEEGHTEGFVPLPFENILKQSSGVAVGFRIPISNFHSLLSLKSLGSYPVPPASHGNTLIAAGPISFYQGSDYDGDTLFMIVLERVQQDIPIGQFVHTIDPSFPEDFVIKAGEFPGIENGQIQHVNGLNIVFALEGAIRTVDKQLTFMRAQLPRARDIRQKAFLNSQIQRLNEIASVIEHTVMLAAKNQIVHLYKEMLLKQSSEKELLTPITFVQVNKTQTDTRTLSTEGLIRFKEGFLSDVTQLGTAHMWYALSKLSKGQLPSYLATQEEIEEELQPIGEFNDFATQLQIKRNSDAGSTGIGITANTLKSLGMLLESTPATKVVDSNGNPVEPTYENTLHPSNRVLEREDIKVNPKYHIKIDEHVYDRMSRRTYDTTGKLVQFFDDPLSVFTTLDTLENLAIDEVKEGRMFILGINPSNSSAFLSGIIMGIPLNVVSLMFKQEAVRQLYESQYVDEIVLQGKLRELATTRSSVTTLSKEQLKEYLGIESLADIDEAKMSTALLIANYTGDFSAFNLSDSQVAELRKLHDYVVFNNILKLTTIAKQIYYVSTILTLLKRLPGTKPGIDSIYDKLHTLYDFKSLDATKRTRAALEHAAKVYLSSVSENPQKELQEFLSSEVFEEFVSQVAHAASINAALRSFSFAATTPTSTNALTNANLLLLPQVSAAVSTLLFLNRVVEEAFPIYSNHLKELAQTILKRSSMFVIPKEEFGRVRQIQAALFQAITSNLTITLGDEEIPLFFDDSYQYTDTSGKVYKGNEAFARRFTDTVFTLKTVRDLIDKNEFIDALEIDKGLVGISIDKLGNEELTERIRRAYLDLWEKDAPLALDFFRYAVITTGLFYTRTSFARVFPWQLIHAYSRALDDRISTIFSKDNPITTQIILKSIEDTVLLQFVRRSKGNLRYIKLTDETKPVVTGKRVASNGRVEDAHQGFEVVGSSTVYYDLKFTNVKNPPTFIRRWATDPHVYMKLDVPSDDAYYRIVGVDSQVPLEVNVLDTASNTDLSKLAIPSDHVIPSTNFVSSNVIYYPQTLSEGHTFYVLDVSESVPLRLREYQVKKSMGSQQYRVVPTGNIKDISIREKFSVKYSGSEILSVLTFAPGVLITTAAEAVQVASEKRDGFSITADTDDVRGDFVLPLKYEEGVDRAEFLSRVSAVVRSIPRFIRGRTKLYVATTILDDLIKKDFPLAQAVARILFDHLRWVHPILREVLSTEETSDFDRMLRLISMVDYQVTGKVKSVSEDMPGKVYVPFNKFSKISSRAVSSIEIGALILMSDGNFAYVLDSDDRGVTAVVLSVEQAARLPQRITPIEVFQSLMDEEIKKYCS